MHRGEQILQRGIVALLRLHENQGHLIFFAVPNGGGRSKVEAAIFKGLGVRAGVSDMVLLFPRRCIFWELKAHGGRLSPEQRLFQVQTTRLGFESAVIRDIGEAAGLLQKYMSEAA